MMEIKWAVQKVSDKLRSKDPALSSFQSLAQAYNGWLTRSLSSSLTPGDIQHHDGAPEGQEDAPQAKHQEVQVIPETKLHVKMSILAKHS